MVFEGNEENESGTSVFTQPKNIPELFCLWECTGESVVVGRRSTQKPSLQAATTGEMELPSSPISQMVAVDVEGRTETMYLQGCVDGSTGGIKFNLCPPELSLSAYLNTKRWMKAMLLDKSRNLKYKSAITAVIRDWILDKQRQSSQAGTAATAAKKGPIVLDIGAGTGLLSLLAAQAGASRVIGCEMFSAVASLAQQLVDLNSHKLGSADVRIVCASSMQLQAVGAGRKLDPMLGAELTIPAADIIVCELFDTVRLSYVRCYIVSGV